ncbi:hypothetical protein EDB73_101589 [Vibrio crassostreae]|nr:hypothetical protein EDB73_101589 [Vibrio crassostreae]
MFQFTNKVQVKLMIINKLKKKLAFRIFIYSGILLFVQVGLFSDVNLSKESNEYVYNYQLDRWQSTFTYGWRSVLNELRESGLTLCDENGSQSQPHNQLLKSYYTSMYDLHITSKYKFHVATYVFNEINYLYSILAKYHYIAQFAVPNTVINNLSELLVSYEQAFTNSTKLHKEIEGILSQLQKMNVNDKAMYQKVCDPKSPFFNEGSLNVVNELNDVTHKVLDNYNIIYASYVKLTNYLSAIKLWLTIMLFLLLQWSIMRKDIET